MVAKRGDARRVELGSPRQYVIIGRTGAHKINQTWSNSSFGAYRFCKVENRFCLYLQYDACLAVVMIRVNKGRRRDEVVVIAPAQAVA